MSSIRSSSSGKPLTSTAPTAVAASNDGAVIPFALFSIACPLLVYLLLFVCYIVNFLLFGVFRLRAQQCVLLANYHVTISAMQPTATLTATFSPHLLPIRMPGLHS